MEKYAKEKKIIVIGAILLVLTLTLGAAYSLWNYFKVGENQELVAGEIYMKYTEGSKSINITNAMPTNTYDPSQVFEFTIEGKNTYTKPIWYEIVINWGEEPEDRHTRIPDEFIRFRLTEQLPGEEEQEVIAAGKYEDFRDGKKIWVNTIGANQTDEIKITYKLYMWVSDEMHLGAGDDASTSDMDMETWNRDAFASAKVSVNGDFTEKTLEEEPEPEPEETTGIATEVLKAKLGEGGLVGIPTTCSEESCTSITDKSTDKSTIREYRYSGATADNYVTFNDEKWRIIGIFKDDSGNEHMKIIRNELIKETDFPTTYQAEGTSFSIRYSGGDRAYWNSTKTGTNSNDWTTAGLMYWLNSKGTDSSDTGYLNKIKAPYQDMIEEATWYLGNVVTNGGTAVTDYTNERGSKTCSSSCSGGDVWSGNSATWTGKIGLMYPSDMGFSTDSSYWNTNMINFSSTHLNTTWLKEGHTNFEWFLSPSSNSSVYVARWYSGGGVSGDYANFSSGVRPVLYLKSDTTINGGEGTSTTPYTLTS